MSLYHRDEPAPLDVEAHREAIDREDAECLANGEPEELTEQQAADLEASFRAMRATWGT
jgi:hypothetical protein